MAKDCENCDAFGCGSRECDFINWCMCESNYNSVFYNFGHISCDPNCTCQTSIYERIRREKIKECKDKLKSEYEKANGPKQYRVTYLWGWANTPENRLYDGEYIFESIDSKGAIQKVKTKYPKVIIKTCDLIKEKEVKI